jgi:hypothetical protein
MLFIPTKSVACLSTSWLLENFYTAKSCKGNQRDPDALILGQKISAFQDSRGLGVGLITPP